MLLTLICFFFLSLSFVLYRQLIGKFKKGWQATPLFQSDKEPESHEQISVIIACKNEAKNLNCLFEALKKQSYPHFEVLLVDDHSDDGSFELANEQMNNFPQLKVLQNEGTGKKQAIRTAVYASRSEWLVSIDADSTPQSGWLDAIGKCFTLEQADLLIGPVSMTSNNSFFQNFQQLEFMSLVASGAGAAGVGSPILCNGANLAFSRKAWLESEKDLHFDIPSGDDIFLLQSIKYRGGKIQFVKSEESIVTTAPGTSLRSFFSQRTRWASKHTMYADRELTYTAVIVLLINFTLITSLLLSPCSVWIFAGFIALLLLKMGVDFRFLQKTAQFFNIRISKMKFFFFSLLYPFYIVFTALRALIYKNSRWQ